MEPTELKSLQELFYDKIKSIEEEYHLYFGLRSIQKRLDCTESICDHFNLNCETLEFCFQQESDLPQEIKDTITHTYQQVFLETRLM